MIRHILPIATMLANLATAPGLAQSLPPAAEVAAGRPQAVRTMEQNRRITMPETLATTPQQANGGGEAAIAGQAGPSAG